MKKIKSILGYAAAALTIAIALAGPFVLYGKFAGAVASLGLSINPVYTGGQADHIIARDGYRIVVNRPVVRRTLFSTVEFVQIAWTPAAKLPPRVADAVGLAPGGPPDLVAAFEVPRDPAAELRVDVTPLSSRATPMRGVGKDSFVRLIARVGDSIVVRVPLRAR